MFPYEIKPLEEDLNKKLLSLYKGEKSGFCQVGPDKWLLPISYTKYAESFYNMELKEDDVFIVTFPRVGTTLSQELIWMINNNLDFEKSAKIPLFERFPFIDMDVLIHDQLGNEMKSLNTDPDIRRTVNAWKTPVDEVLNMTPSPRHIKTHIPLSLLPPNILEKSKVIYVARNVKDVAVSYYYHNKLIRLHDYVGDFETYWNLFKNDLVVYAPYWKHIEEGWEKKEHPNLLFLFYEDIVKDMKNQIKKVASFLKKPMTESDVEKLYNHLQIDNFSQKVPIFAKGDVKGWLNQTPEGFIRKGNSREKKDFTEELLKDANAWIQDHVTKNNIKFPQY